MAVHAVTPFLWFEKGAEDAANLYVSLFDNSRVLSMSYCGAFGPGPQGSVLVVSIELEGRTVTMMNGGPVYKLDRGFSLMVECIDQEDIDRLWEGLGDGGTHHKCGWLTDRFGLSWQINYAGLSMLMSSPTAGAVMVAMGKMGKIDIETLRAAAGL